MIKHPSYLLCDLKRSICNVKFIISILLTTGILLLATLEGISLDTDVLYVFSLVMYGMPAMIILVSGSLAYADSFCEDIEHRYILHFVLRGNVKNYVLSKIIAIFSVTTLSITLGIFLFASILHLKLEWADTSSLQYDYIIHSGGLRFFLFHKLYALYYLAYGIQYGVLAGILALWASYLSIFIPNRMLVLSAPMLIYYFVDFVLSNASTKTLNLFLIFSASNNIFSNDFLSILLVIMLAILNIFLVRILLLKSLRRNIFE